MEERSVKITIEQAREWVNSDNETLKTLALSAYSKEELEEGLKKALKLIKK